MMKRIIGILLTAMVLLTFGISAFADTTGSNNTIEIGNFTIIFDENTTLSPEEQLRLAQCRANVDHFEAPGPQQKNVLCSLFGHKTTTETVIVIEHKVSATQPRCVKTYEDVTGCTRCDTVTIIDVLSSTYFFCCD